MNSSTQARSVSATSDFYQRAGFARLLRWALQGAQIAGPNAAARLARRVFLTPLPLKWTQRSKPWPAIWQHEYWPFGSGRISLYRSAAAPGQPLAVLLHGWGGHAAQMQPLAQALHARGWATVVLEAPGHGRSAGSISSLAQFARALEYVQARLAQEGLAVNAVLAHSLGASAAAYAVARGLPVQRLVLLAAPDAPQRFTHFFAQVFGLQESLRQRLQAGIEAQETIVMAQFDAALIGPRIAAPTLLVHDQADAINPFSGGERLARHLPHSQLHATQGLGHRRILSDAGVLQRVEAFLCTPQSL